jgi:hypothetical protein
MGLCGVGWASAQVRCAVKYNGNIFLSRAAASAAAVSGCHLLFLYHNSHGGGVGLR